MSKEWAEQVAAAEAEAQRHQAAEELAEHRFQAVKAEKQIIMDDYITADGWQGRLTADDLREYAFHRLDDMTVRAVHHIVRNEPDAARTLVADDFAWRSLIAHPTRRKLRVLLMRVFLRAALAVGAARMTVPILVRTEGIRL